MKNALVNSTTGNLEVKVRGIELWEVTNDAQALPGFISLIAHYTEWDARLGRWLNVLLVECAPLEAVAA
jgi:hypothetical protein